MKTVQCPKCNTNGCDANIPHLCGPDPAVVGGAALGMSLAAPVSTADEIREAISEVELLIEVHRVKDGPRNSKERTKQAEQHELVRRLTKIRRALYRAFDVVA